MNLNINQKGRPKSLLRNSWGHKYEERSFRGAFFCLG